MSPPTRVEHARILRRVLEATTWHRPVASADSLCPHHSQRCRAAATARSRQHAARPPLPTCRSHLRAATARSAKLFRTYVALDSRSRHIVQHAASPGLNGKTSPRDAALPHPGRLFFLTFDFTFYLFCIRGSRAPSCSIHHRAVLCSALLRSCQSTPLAHGSMAWPTSFCL